MTDSTRAWIVAMTALGASVMGCGRVDSPALPEGRVVFGSAAALGPFLDRLALLEGTPLGGAAAAARARISSCEEVFGHCPSEADCLLSEALACTQGDRHRGLEELRGEAGWMVGWRRGEATSAILWASGDPAQPSLRAEVRSPLDGAMGFLLPAVEGPGPARLSATDAILQIRSRPAGGLDLASLTTAGGWSGKLFKLQAELFVGTSLAGTWELASYLPLEGQQIPPTALAVDFTNRERTVEAMERFLQEVMRTWPLRRSERTIGGWEGACMSNLNVLPELAPCYAATDETLVVGWNAASVELALGDGRPDDEGERSWAYLALDRLPEADARLRRASGADESTAVQYPWNRVTGHGRREGAVFVLEVGLGGEGSGR